MNYIYNSLGKLIKVLPNVFSLKANEYIFIWNGNDKNLMKQPAGIYFCRLNMKQSNSIKILKIN